MEGPNKRYRCWMCQQDLSRSVICDEMDVPLWSECRQRNVIRQRILIRHKKEITSALIWKKRAAIWIHLNMYGDKINASNHHAILSKCYERYLNDAVLTALSAVYHILYPNINQFVPASFSPTFDLQ